MLCGLETLAKYEMIFFVTYYLSPNLNMYLIPAKACMLCDG